LNYRIIFLLIFFSIVLSTNALGFFYVENHSDTFRLDHTVSDFSTQNNNRFYFYDNHFAPNEEDVLFRSCQGFVHAAQIKADMPIKILSKTSVPVEYSIDRMLLANLKINSLIEEYKKLQKKVRMMLESDNPASEYKQINNQPIDDTRQVEPATIENEKIRLLNQIINASRASHFLQVDGSSDMLTISADQIPVETDRKIVGNLIFYSNAHPAQASETNIDPDNAVYDSQKRSFSSTRKPSVFFIKTINYILHNRIEVLFYIIFISIVVFFIRIQVRQ